jgi:hypothetical protein
MCMVDARGADYTPERSSKLAGYHPRANALRSRLAGA